MSNSIAAIILTKSEDKRIVRCLGLRQGLL